MSEQIRIAELDGLRGCAILLVLLFHFKQGMFPGAFIGVDLFFVLSGYVVTRSIQNEYGRTGRLNVRRFYLRRAGRLLPAALAAIVGTLILRAATGALAPADGVAALALLGTALNGLLAAGMLYDTGFVHSWSLALEGQFYLLWPIAWLLLFPQRRSGLGIAVVAGVMAASGAWAVFLSFHGAPWFRIYFGSDTRTQALLAGCLLAIVGIRALPISVLRLWPIPVLVLFALVLTADNHDPSFGLGGYSVTAMMGVWLIASALKARSLLQWILRAPPLLWLGLRSYSLFLWHLPVGLAIYSWGLPAWNFLATAISLALADISYRTFEEPFMRRGRGAGGRATGEASEQDGDRRDCRSPGS